MPVTANARKGLTFAKDFQYTESKLANARGSTDDGA